MIQKKTTRNWKRIKTSQQILSHQNNSQIKYTEIKKKPRKTTTTQTRDIVSAISFTYFCQYERNHRDNHKKFFHQTKILVCNRIKNMDEKCEK